MASGFDQPIREQKRLQTAVQTFQLELFQYPSYVVPAPADRQLCRIVKTRNGMTSSVGLSPKSGLDSSKRP